MHAFLLLATITAFAQQPTLISPGLARNSGIEPTSNIAYTRLYLSSTPAPDAVDLTHPTLIAQCTQDSTGKLSFELLFNFGDIADTAFYPPWKPSEEHGIVRPPRSYTHLTLDFLGYRKVKPLKTEFEILRNPSGQLLYNNPGMHSQNLEGPSFILQYLRALPTLRITDAIGRTAQFLTTPLLDRIHAEPLCKASGL
jgi:hypothetical protein